MNKNQATAVDLANPVRDALILDSQDKTPFRNRRDLVIIVEAIDCIPQGDPELENIPRINPITSRGFITDSGLKRQIRNGVEYHLSGVPGYDIFISRRAVLNTKMEAICSRAGIIPPSGEETDEEDSEDKGKKKVTKKKFNGNDNDALRRAICQENFDIRAFGYVTGADPITGPIQLSIGNTVCPVSPLQDAITIQAVRTEAEAKKYNNNNRTMGRRPRISHGIYVFNGIASPILASRTGFTEGDFKVFMTELLRSWQDIPSSTKIGMEVRQVISFEHQGIGVATPAKIRRLVKIVPKVQNPQCWEDYDIQIDRDKIPEEVTLKIYNP